MSMAPRSSSLLIPFETLVNRCIAQDIRLAEGISRHAGRILLIQVTVPTLSIYLHFYPGSVILSFDPPAPLPDRDGPADSPDPMGAQTGSADFTGTRESPAAGPPFTASRGEDACISGSALAMLRLLTDRSDTRSLVNPAIQISGDVEFVQSVYRLFAAMEIDWQEPLSQVIGDVPVQGLQQLFDGLRSFTRKTADSARRNLDEYLHEESRLVPPLHQVEAFDQGLDDLRLRLDRLQARVQRLASGIDRRRQRPEG
jgi:ubiquinone biosynthesis protein UbiJ